MRERKMSGIIVGIDGSSHSHTALEWAMNEAAIRHESLTVITVQQVAASGWGGIVVYPTDQEFLLQTQKAAQEAVDKAAQQLGGAAPPATVRAVVGIPAAELIAASWGADLLVLGSRGAGGFTRLMMGSVSSQVSHHAHCPVVIVPDAISRAA
jgi:nucleotide-binding universal stress UspA family protein